VASLVKLEEDTFVAKSIEWERRTEMARSDLPAGEILMPSVRKDEVGSILGTSTGDRSVPAVSKSLPGASATVAG